MKSLIDIYQNDLHPPPDKYTSYFPVYEQFFSKFREKEMTFVEVGVQRGGSLNMWRKYFGASAKIIGIDIDKNVLAHQREDLQIVIGDQADPNFWKQFLSTVDKIDIFLDDGGHTMVQQKNTLLSVWPKIADGGVYLCEDTHTSYFNWCGNGLNKDWTMMEYSKNMVDMVNIMHWDEPHKDPSMSNMFQDVGSVHYYNSMIVMTKGQPKWERPHPFYT